MPFGFGLSYASFTYNTSSVSSDVGAHSSAGIDRLSLTPLRKLLAAQAQRQQAHRSEDGAFAASGLFLKTADVAAMGPAIQYTVTVTNTGKVDSDDAVLGFIAPPGAGQNGVPLQTLFDFQRIHVPAGK